MTIDHHEKGDGDLGREFSDPCFNNDNRLPPPSAGGRAIEKEGEVETRHLLMLETKLSEWYEQMAEDNQYDVWFADDIDIRMAKAAEQVFDAACEASTATKEEECATS